MPPVVPFAFMIRDVKMVWREQSSNQCVLKAVIKGSRLVFNDQNGHFLCIFLCYNMNIIINLRTSAIVGNLLIIKDFDHECKRNYRRH